MRRADLEGRVEEGECFLSEVGEVPERKGAVVVDAAGD